MVALRRLARATFLSWEPLHQLRWPRTTIPRLKWTPRTHKENPSSLSVFLVHLGTSITYNSMPSKAVKIKIGKIFFPLMLIITFDWNVITALLFCCLVQYRRGLALKDSNRVAQSSSPFFPFFALKLFKEANHHKVHLKEEKKPAKAALKNSIKRFLWSCSALWSLYFYQLYYSKEIEKLYKA